MFKKGIKYLLLILPFVSFGQNSTYLGIELGPKFEVYQSTDNGNGLYTKPFFFSPIFGLTIGKEINETFLLETGLQINEYGKSYRIKGEGFGGYGVSNALDAYQIPLRLKTRLNLLKDKLSLVTSVGYTFAINGDYGSTGSGSSFSSGSSSAGIDSTRSKHTSTYSLKKSYGLIETGLALEYKFKNSIRLSLAANYMTGLSRVVEADVKYWINDGPEQTGTVFSNGDYYSIFIGLKYPICELWTKNIDK
ncbi:hypothetical protein N9595_03235 [Bacteroidia bacterium]|nr:hypothetical protein [Bacteroidia bacterium]